MVVWKSRLEDKRKGPGKGISARISPSAKDSEVPKLLFFNEKNIRKIQMFFYVENSL